MISFSMAAVEYWDGDTVQSRAERQHLYGGAGVPMVGT